MARRPSNLRNDMLSAKQLHEFHRSLLLLSPEIVRDRYIKIVDRCRFMELATPRMMQELVTIWRVLWKWRR
jgi:hypothetical protein